MTDIQTESHTTSRRWVAPAPGAPDTWVREEHTAPEPQVGEIRVLVRAAGVNPADAKHVLRERPGTTFPVPIGYEISGEVTAVGPETSIGSGPVSVGDDVLAFRIQGGYADEVTIPAEKAFHKPDNLSHPEAANLLLAGTTAAEMLHVVAATSGETILLHAASGAVGVIVLQLAARAGIRVIGTTGSAGSARVRQFGGIPVAYGPGLADRVRELADGAQISAALDAAGTAEATEVSLELVRDRDRIVTIVDPSAAQEHGFRAIAGSKPDSAAFRDEARPMLVDLAAAGDLIVPVAQTFPLAEAPEALALLAQGHPGGKLALIP
ncbi:NADP-dependent oxidoreductase [Microbacterium pseudoresistens]|uniref:NADPH:quinone reductase-like Zn-dependent oxidoreductase n=1 Tax=Microbacterium pseudoresistens TaxID=640634 RepID=A0A7Y9EWQ7_9MICO|nr:NADP-dependent oxidoreductase [Microbacterium pseudoresistens]NYD55338.1 NADPH:quinone reductase-like Zn-dependent oxidoreductase [Microbacterium pseudoresistens]